MMWKGRIGKVSGEACFFNDVGQEINATPQSPEQEREEP